MNTTISQKRDSQGAGHQSAKDTNGSEGDDGGDSEARAIAAVYAVVRVKAMAAAATVTVALMTARKVAAR